MEANMSKLSPSILCLILILCMIFVPDGSLQAQVTGVIAGRVVDASSGDYLPGANVFVEGTSIGAATDREGSFVILNVPEGTYTLMVNYIGYSDFSTEFTISSSQTRVILDDIQLQISAFEADAIVVEGQLEGQIKALNRQRVSANIKNVVAREQMEKFPDYTMADVLQRVPGVYLDRDQGEGRYFSIRGAEPRLNNVKVDGEELATNRVEERYTQLDVVGSNQMASVEVVKALTPDMDADAIGGTVNLISRSAFDYQGQRLRATVGAGYADLRGTGLWQGKFSYSNRFGANGNIGLPLTANWDRTDKGAENSEKGWGDRTSEGGEDIPWALREMDFRDYYNIRDRIGFGGSFEYRLDNDNRFYFNATWNKLNDDQERGRRRLRIDRGDYISREVVEGARIIVQSEARVEELIMQQFSAGGSHQFDDFSFDYKVAYSYAEEQHPEQIETEFEVRGVNMQLGFDDNLFPDMSFTNLNDVDVFDPSVYGFEQIDYRETFASDQNMGGSVNFKMPFRLGDYASELKVGGKVRLKEKDRDDSRWGYDWNGPDLTLADFVSTDRPGDKEEFLRDTYRYGPQPDYDDVEDFFKTNRDGLLEGDLDIWDSRGQSYKAKETIAAGYAMATVNFNKLTVLGGARLENTSNDYTGTFLLYDDSGDLIADRDTTDERTYSHFLPMLHLKYQLGRMTNIRAAVTTSISRPNYFDLVPYRSENPESQRLRVGNPELEVTDALSFDLMAEHYFSGVGVLSASVFHKELDNIIFEKEVDIEQPGSQYDGWEYRGPVNGGKASITGLEVNWQQQLTFLPGALSGIGIYANYTKTWATSDLRSDAAYTLEQDIRSDADELPGQASDVGNLAISYEWGGFSGRVSLMYQGEYLEVVGGAADDSEDEWKDSHFQIDISANMKVLPQLDVFAEFVNLTDTPEIDYLGISDRPIVQYYYSWWMRAGVKYSL
jgi:TonB-dependent receptor